MADDEPMTYEWSASRAPESGIAISKALVTPGIGGMDVRIRLTFAGPSILTLTMDYRDAVDFAKFMLDASRTKVRAAGGD